MLPFVLDFLKAYNIIYGQVHYSSCNNLVYKDRPSVAASGSAGQGTLHNRGFATSENTFCVVTRRRKPSGRYAN